LYQCQGLSRLSETLNDWGNPPGVRPLDGHSIHKAAKIKTYVEQSKGMLKLFYLRPYSPQLNPDGTVWAHVKRDVSRRLVENKEHMKQLALSVLRRLQKLPILVMSFFRKPEYRYILE
jgi:transposase